MSLPNGRVTNFLFFLSTFDISLRFNSQKKLLNLIKCNVFFVNIFSFSLGKTMSGASLVFESVGRGQIGRDQNI